MSETKRNTILSKLKELATLTLKKEETIESVESKFTDAKLDDGSIIRYEEDVIATGVKVMVVGEDGSVLPMPTGSYVLEDGTTFDIVDEDGTADNVVIAEVEEETAKEEVMEEKEVPAASAPAVEKAAKSIVETTSKETRFEEDLVDVKKDVVEEKVEAKDENDIAIEAGFKKEVLSFKGDIDKLNETVDKQSKLIKDMFALIEDLGNEDEVKSPETKKNVFRRNVTSKERRAEIKAKFKAQL